MDGWREGAGGRRADLRAVPACGSAHSVDAIIHGEPRPPLLKARTDGVSVGLREPAPLLLVGPRCHRPDVGETGYIVVIDELLQGLLRGLAPKLGPGRPELGGGIWKPHAGLEGEKLVATAGEAASHEVRRALPLVYVPLP